MKSKKLITVLASTFITASLLFCSCGSSSNQKTVDESNIKDTIVYALTTSPTGIFNPLISNSTYDSNVTSLLYCGLLTFDENFNIENDLAKEYKVSDDNLKYTFKLKDDLKWQDGKPLTTEDIYYTFNCLADPKYDGSCKSIIEGLKGSKDALQGKSSTIEGIKVIDDKTIEFNFDKPHSVSLTDIGTLPILPKHIWGEIPPDKWQEKTDLLKNPIGSGPYKLVKFENGQSVEFEKNENYAGKKVKTEKFIFKVTNPETAQGELANGTVDIADISTLKTNEVDSLKDQNFNIIKYADHSVIYMGLNLRNPLFKDVKVRQALNYGINKKEALDKLSEGNGVPVSIPMLPSSFAYPKDGELNNYDFNVEKAKSLLKEAGFSDKDNDGIIENTEGKKFTVSLHCPSNSKAQEQRALLIQSNLKDLGIKVDIKTMEFSTLMQQVVGDHEFDMYMMLNMLPIDPDPKAYWYSDAASDKKNDFAWNISSYKNKEVDKLIDEGLSTTDQKKRAEIYLKYAKIMNNDVPWVCFFSPNIIKATNPKLHNYKPVTNLDFVNIEDWYVEK